MTNEARLVEAAERALKFLSNQVQGRYNSPNEDQLCGEALARALRLYRAAAAHEFDETDLALGKE